MIREFPIVSEKVEEIIKLRGVDVPLSQFIENLELLGPAFMQCGRITKFIPDGVELCTRPVGHKGGCK